MADFDEFWDYGNPKETERRFLELLPGARDRNESGYLAELLTQIARTQGLQCRFDEAHATLGEAEDLIAGVDGLPRVRLLLERGRVFNSSGQGDKSRPFFRRAWDLALKLREDFYAVDAAHMLAIVSSGLEALEWNIRALDLARKSEDERARKWLASLHNNLGWAYHDLARYAEALNHFERALAFRERRGDEREIRIARWAVGRTLRSLGKYQEARQIQEENLAEAEASSDPDGFIHEELGEILLALGQTEAAPAHFRRAYELLSKDPWLTETEPARLERIRSLADLRQGS